MGCGATKEEPKKAADPLDQVPADFPAGVEAKREFYKNWDESVLACRVLQCYPKDEAEIVKVANWAVGKKWTMRATGIKHNWSPITIEPQGATVDLDGVVLVNLMKYMTKVTVHPGKDGQAPYCVAQLGVKSLDFMTALENHKEGGTADIGYGLVHTPAPDSITLGGMLAIDGHGTAVPSEVEKPFNDPAKANFGTYSNRILAVRALVYDEATKAYAFKEFRRERGDEILPFLSHVGRSILSEATLQVEKNYYMRCKSILNVHWKKMFPTADDPKNPQPDSMAWHLKHSGRAEAIWFPFTEYPWLKVWTATDATKPADAKAVTNACNYPFSDNLGDDITELFRTVMGQAQDVKESQIQMALNKDKERMGNDHDKIPAHEKLKDFVTDLGNDIAQAGASLIGTPKLTPTLSKMVWLRVVTGLTTTGTWDLWGPSKNTLIYVKDTTLLVTANGYVVMTNEDNVQDCMYEFTQMYDKLLTKFQKEGKFPVSCPLEIRVTGVDDPTPIGNGTFATPPMSALCYDDDAKAHKWNRALWFDVLSLPNAPHSNEFYVEMEKMVRECAAFNGTKGRIRPEWSKGWGYSDKGPWKNQDFLDHTRKTLPRWNEMMAALDKHDPNKLFTNPWMSKFFVAVPGGKDKAAPVAAAAPAAAPAKADESQYDLRTKSAVIAARAPIGVKVEAGKTYYWCTCGKSKNQPFCDGSHQGSDFKPLAWTATESKDVYFCTCKQTKTAPFCDGSHTSLPAPAVAPAASEHSGLVAKDESQYDLRTKHAVIAARAPIGVKVEAGKTYYWCTCGKSKNQPFCDGSHQGSEFRPMAWTATESKDVYFCACKHTKNAPFCDGSHASLPAAAPADAAAAPAKADESQYDLRTKHAVIAARAPIGVKVEAGKTYYWCTCGKSKNQPFCDGSHQGSEFKPLAWTATEAKEVHFCACKHTKNAPFCDGSHAALPAAAPAA